MKEREGERVPSEENERELGVSSLPPFFVALFSPRSAGTIAPRLLTERLEQATQVNAGHLTSLASKLFGCPVTAFIFILMSYFSFSYPANITFKINKSWAYCI